MYDKDFRTIAEFMKSKYGVDLNDKEAVVQGRLMNLVVREGYNSYGDFIDDMFADKTGVMEKQLVNVLTTNHTYFMREFEHFEFLREVILPELKKSLQDTRDLRIWCGASSTGEEPYMIAMTILQFFGLEHSSWDTKVLATDISTEALQTAIEGEYSGEMIEKLTDYWKRRFFKKGSFEGMYRVTDELKQEVIFRQFNLMEDFPFRKKMHVIFLRNVMIYFDTDTKNKLMQKVYDALAPGGYLIVGKTEAVDTAIIPFNMVSPSIFKKPL